MTKIKQLFNNLIQYENKIPGIAEGFEILRSFDNIKESVAQKNEVKYYNFVDDCFYYYSFDDLNQKIYEICHKKMIGTLSKNMIYIYMYKILERKIADLKYNFVSSDITVHSLLRKIIEGMRKNDKGYLNISFNGVLNNFKYSFFDSGVSNVDFKNMIFDYFVDLDEILKFDSVIDNIECLAQFEPEFTQLFSINFDTILLGKSPIFDVFETYNTVELDLKFMDFELIKNDKTFIWYVISKTVEHISLHSNLNNLMYDLIKKNDKN